MDLRGQSRHARRIVRLFMLMLVAALVLPAVPAFAQTPLGTLSLPSNVLVAPGQTVQVPISVVNPTTGITGIDITITYDSSRLTATGVARAPAIADTEKWYMLSNLTPPGSVRIGIANDGTTAINATSAVAIISFQAIGGATGLVPLTFTRGDLNEVAATKVNGSMRINTAPVANGDAYATNEDTTLNVPAPGVPGVLANDTDVPDNDPLTAALVTNVTHGALTLNANGSFSYTPTPGYFGPDSFTYRAVDAYGQSAPATVTIDVGSVNDPPTAIIGGPYNVNEGSSIALNGSATDPDLPHDTLTFDWDLDNDGGYDDATGQTPTFSAVNRDGPGSQIIGLRVSDGNGGVDTKSTTVAILNVAPTADAGGPYFVNEWGTVALSGLGSSDPAGPIRDPLTYAWDLDNDGQYNNSTSATPTFSAAAIVGPASRTVGLQVNDGDGGIGTDTASVTIQDVVALDLPELDAKWAEPVVFPVSMTGLNSALTQIDLTLSYPSALLTYGGATGTGLTNGWTVVVLVNTPGTLGLRLTGNTPLGAASGNVALVNFTSTSAGGNTANLTMSAVAINGGNVVATVATGSIHLYQRYSVAGKVTYWKDAKVVPDVALALTGFDPQNDTSDIAGDFGWAQVYEGAHTLTPSKSEGVNGITAFDAALALRHTVGLSLLTGDAFTVADVTGNGQVTSDDASEMLAMSIGAPIGTFPDTGTIWRFAPPTRSYTPLAANQPAQNFTALLMGDPSGNWDSTLSAAELAAARGNTGALPVRVTVARTSPTTAVLTIALVAAPADTLAIDLAVDLGSAASVKTSAAVQNVMVGIGKPVDGMLRIGLAAAEPLANGTVATVELALPANAPVTADVLELMVNEQPLVTQISSTYLPFIGR